jgi:hypothetical protein
LLIRLFIFFNKNRKDKSSCCFSILKAKCHVNIKKTLKKH